MADVTEPTTRSHYILAVSALAGVGPWTALAVARSFPVVAGWFAASAEEREAKIGRPYLGRLGELTEERWPALLLEGQRIVERHGSSGIRLVSVDDDDYPPLLKLAPKPPVILYVLGDLAVLRTDATVAIVGTRSPTASGVATAKRLATMLAQEHFTVISGLAVGIDQAGHEGALEGGGSTIAVLGTAIDKVYPAANRELAQRIKASGGALVSEYPIDFLTSGRHFVERDRIQAGMSVAVIAVQTGVEGGTQHTIRSAKEASRSIIVPRPRPEKSDEKNAGIRELIAAGGVRVIESRDDYPALVAFLHERRKSLLADAAQKATMPDPGADSRTGQATSSRRGGKAAKSKHQTTLPF